MDWELLSQESPQDPEFLDSIENGRLQYAIDSFVFEMRNTDKCSF